MITTTMGQVVAAEAVLQRIAQQAFSAKIGYRIATLLRKLQPDVTHFTAENQKLVRELGDPLVLPDGNHGFRVRPDNLEMYQIRIGEVTAVEVSIECGPLTLSDLATATVTPAELFALGPFVIEEPEKGSDG